MKPSSVSFLFFAFLLSPLLAKEPQAVSEPSALIHLRQRWKGAQARVLKPVNQKYERALTKMKLRYTKAGNLQAALVVQKELEQLKSKTTLAAAPAKASVSPGHLDKKALEKWLAGKKWEWHCGDLDVPVHAILWTKPSGEGAYFEKGKSEPSTKISLSWKVIGTGKIHLFFLFMKDGSFRDWVFKMAKDGKTAVSTKEGGTKDLKTLKLVEE